MGPPVESVGELGVAIPVVPADAPVNVVDELFRHDRNLRAVAVARREGPWGILTRGQVEYQLSGRLGYGRALHARSTAARLVPEYQLVVAGDIGLEEAADLALARPEPVRYDDFLLLGEGGPRAVAVSRVFEELSARLRHAAWHDALTGLPNRRWLSEQGTSFLASSDPERTAILYIDLDNFKTVNDTHGHDVGNEVLVQFSRRLQASLRTSDVAVRLGGDEFIALLADISELDAQRVGQRVLDAILEPLPYGEYSLQLSATIGLVMGKEVEGDDALGPLDALLRHADGAMLAGKQHGKQRVQRLDRRESDPFARLAQIRRRLAEAIEEDAFDFSFEPVLELTSNSCSDLQARLSWDTPELGLLRADEFMPVADRSGEGQAIGRGAVDRVCAQARMLRDEGRPSRIALDVSPAWLSTGKLAEDVLAALAKHELPGAALQLDFSGRIGLVDPEQASGQLKRLRRAGVEIALDHYGSEQATVALLRSLPFSVLNVAPSLAARVDVDPTDAVILGGVVSMGHALGIAVSAPGIERPGQLEVLRELGCDRAQGPLITESLRVSFAARSEMVCFADEGAPNVS
ncbi:putative bifunctional diguanylate cyclase/phosphodiesterase [Sinomonas humi]|nr:EAL domain-containing protein [Sinomonas humi]